LLFACGSSLLPAGRPGIESSFLKRLMIILVYLGSVLFSFVYIGTSLSLVMPDLQTGHVKVSCLY
jgi:hypothetical protein